MTVYILGGGPTALALANGLAESSINFVLMERSDGLGGMARTIQWNDYGLHDLGPHKIFTLDQKLMQRVEALLPMEDWLTRPKKSSIFMKSKYLPYPPSPFSLVGVYGPLAFCSMAAGYAASILKNLIIKQPPESFQDDLVRRLGQGIYEALFKPIALKLWGDPAILDAKLSKGRVQTPSIIEVAKRMLGIHAKSEFEALEFRYPKGGLNRIWDAIREKSSGYGKFMLNTEITGINIKDGAVMEISYKAHDTGAEDIIRIGKDDFVFSTIPLSTLPPLMKGSISERINALIIDFIVLNDLLLVFLKVDKESLIDECWVFVPDQDIIFHRLSEQESFDPSMTHGGSIVCCEIMSNELRDMSSMDNASLISKTLKGLDDMGYTGFKVIDKRVIRLNKSYPVYKKGFEPALDNILEEMDGFTNFRTIGRHGSFNYIGTLDCMDIGYGAASWFIACNGQDRQLWAEERRRTRHYPVLD